MLKDKVNSLKTCMESIQGAETFCKHPVHNLCSLSGGVSLVVTVTTIDYNMYILREPRIEQDKQPTHLPLACIGLVGGVTCTEPPMPWPSSREGRCTANHTALGSLGCGTRGCGRVGAGWSGGKRSGSSL